METVNDTDAPAGGAPPYRRPERLTRATDDKVLGGLAGGLGRYFGIDPIVFRIAFVVLTLAGGSGILLYLIGWLVIPDDRGTAALRRVGRERNQKLLTAILVGGGALILLDQLTNRGGSDVPIGVVLVAMGALVLWSRRQDGGDDDRRPPTAGGSGTGGSTGTSTLPAEPPPAPTPPPAAPQPDADVSGSETTTPMVALAPPAPTPTPTRRPPKPRSVLVPITLSLLAVLAGGLSLLGVSVVTGLALALVLTGGALVVGAWRGRARWLIPIGLVLAGALAVASLADVPVRGGTGEVTFRPTTLADVRSPYRLAAGHLTVDLAGLDLAGSALTVVASDAAGQIDIVVPDGVAVDVDAHVGAGNLVVLGREADGLDIGRTVSEPGVEGGGHLVVRARVGFGRVEVRRASA